jgi:uroporphyrinogen III methyltransferase / synthase
LTTGKTGRVYLVGAGPGDPGLMTLRAVEAIEKADTILFDRLIPKEAMESARTDAERVFVGKGGGGQGVPQEQTEALMVQRAREGKVVVRLKGGDPFVFGRGGEEAIALRKAKIPFEVIPGITAALAAAANAGIPLTHRGRSAAVAFIAGHARAGAPGEADGAGTSAKPAGADAPGALDDQDASREPAGADAEPDLDWPAAAAFQGTLVFYMAVRRLPEIAASLMKAGRPETEPAAVIERASEPDERIVTGTLDTIAGRAGEEAVKAPAVVIVGATVELAKEIGAREGGIRLPLSGRTVAVTRARGQADGLTKRLRELGAAVVQAPVIRVEPIVDVDFTPLDPTPYDLICVTSPNAVKCLFERIASGRLDARALAGAHIAAIGPTTAHALAEHGIIADVVPHRFVAESLVEALGELPIRRALVARARNARDVLPKALRARGVEVDVVDLYETVAEPLSEPALKAACEADYVTFTSSSTVHFFLQAAGGPTALSAGTKTVAIGPATAATLREHGVEPRATARRHDVEGIVEAVLADAAAREE